MRSAKVLPLKRRRKGKTDYKRRLKLLKSKKPRVVIRKSNNYVNLQLVEFEVRNFREITKCNFNSKRLKDFGWDYSKKNLPACYLSGLAFGLECKKNKTGEGVSDLGTQVVTKGNKIFSALKGCVDAGMNINYSEKHFPSEDRIKGRHISEGVEKKFKEVVQKIWDYYGKKRR